MAASDKRKSLMTTGGLGRAPNRAMLRGVGFLDEDFDRPMRAYRQAISSPARR
jgi:dihydroxy-acid dehydratase